MPVKKYQEFLDKHHVKYVTIKHSPAYTAQEIAASAHIPRKEVAKTVNRPTWLIACLAVLKAGAVVVPLDVQFGSREVARDGHA